MRILCIADIHGHAGPLQRVLAFGKAQGCTVVLVAGDLCFPGPEPLETWKLLMGVRAHCVQGVSDRAISTLDPDDLPAEDDAQKERVERLRETQSALGQVILERLARLPTTFRMTLEDGGELLLVHGSPADPTTSISHDMDDDEVLALMGDEPADLVVCGGSHVPFERMAEPTRIIAVGSVGEAPTPGVAHAVILDTSSSGIQSQILQLVLDPRESAGETEGGE
jgi:predicted phosphodiesterase